MAFLAGESNLLNAAISLIVIVRAQSLGASPAGIGLIFNPASVGGIAGALLARA